MQAANQLSKKFHSLDCSAQEASSRAPTGGGRLQHSVSIVVELASERHQAGGVGRADDEHEVEEEEEEEEEDEDEGECLGSELARRVRVVDEADKMFQQQHKLAEEPRAHSADGQLQRANAAGSLPHQRRSMSTATPVQWAVAGACELAERGGLSELSMRRNTHHHVKEAHELQLAAGGCQRAHSLEHKHTAATGRRRNHHQHRQQLTREQPAAVATATADHQEEPKQTSTKAALDLQWDSADNFGRQLSSAPGTRPPPVSSVPLGRRQSLQLNSLLNNYTYLCRTGRSLTEEEQRGERKFNEHLRQNLSSATCTHDENQQQQQQQQQSVAARLQLTQVPASSQTQATRTRYIQSRAQDPAGGPPLRPAARQQQQQQRPSSARSRPARQTRRVSFSSIDPITIVGQPTATCSVSPPPPPTGKRYSIAGLTPLGAAPTGPATAMSLADRSAPTEAESTAAAAAAATATTMTTTTPAAADTLLRGATKCRTDTDDDTQPPAPQPEDRRNQSSAAADNDERVQSIMANARLRQQEFARLLEEHEQIVNEINRFETKISSQSSSRNSLQQHESNSNSNSTSSSPTPPATGQPTEGLDSPTSTS